MRAIVAYSHRSINGYNKVMKSYFTNLSKKEVAVFKKLNTPQKIQDFLITLPFNFEKNKPSLVSPRTLLSTRTAHCLEGALFASAVLAYHNIPTKLLDLQPHFNSKDSGHAVALFKQDGYWGAISKTNHGVLRFRDAMYKSPRELAISYFHEYILPDGTKNLESFTVFDLKKIKKDWVCDIDDVWYVEKTLEHCSYTSLLPHKKFKLRKADPIERTIGDVVEWSGAKYR